MKAIYYLTITFSLLCIGAVFGQEGNSAFREILENKETQEVLRTLKNDPENAVRAASQNPDDLVRNMLGVYADSQKKEDSENPPATRGSKSQSEKAITNINKILAKPVSGEQALPVPVGDIKDLKVNSDQIRKLRSAVAETVPELTNVMPEEPAEVPANPPAKPTISEVPSLPEVKDPVASTPPPAPAMNRGTPLNFTSRNAPPAPVRNMQPTTPQIPDSPELFAAAPTPQPLERRYPKPKKFQPTVPATDASVSRPKPKTDTMVITSSESEMDNKNHLLTFRGDVLVEMDGMELRCDTLKVHLNSTNEMERIVATGGMVEIKKIGEGGKLQVAKAKKAEHVAATNTTTLSGGPPYLQNGDQYVNTDSEDSQIILGGDGKYTVKSPKAVGRTVIVVPIGNSKKFTTDLNLDEKLKKISR